MILTAIFGSFILICACLCRVCKSQAGPGQHFGMNSSPNEPFQVDMAPILTGRDSSLPPYLTGTDFNLTNHPSAQNGVCNVFPQLASASPHSGEPPENGAYTVPHRLPSAQSQCDEQPEKGANNSKYSVEDSENRHTYRTPYFSTSKNNVTNPIHTGTDLSELPPPPTYDMVMSADSLYLSSETPTATIGNPDDDEANDDGEDSGRNTDVDRMSYEPFQVDVSAIPRSDSPPPYGSLVFDRLDKHGTSEWDPSLPRYICVTDYNTKCPSSQLLDGDLPQDGACYELPQLSSAPPQSGDQYISVPFSVPYQVSESESRQTYGTSRHSTSSDKQATPNPPQPPIDSGIELAEATFVSS
ncbi:hypothetical protein MAR_011556 [Mya arenaria]|uniref:Uncharacterized protein n=1 Tax=Mya arenaria TaxID=6604 RepID=A0ABY7FUN2_MYAAR|nr:hypothetical protein MAR_011556 [Mya arenaria]